MPTYKNNTADVIWDGNECFSPGQEKETLKILTNTDLTLTNAEPYFNPLINETTLTFSSSGETQTLSVDQSSVFLRLKNVSGTVRIYFNSISNLPSFTVNEAVSIRNNNKINSLVIMNVNNGSSVLTVKEVKFSDTEVIFN